MTRLEQDVSDPIPFLLGLIPNNRPMRGQDSFLELDHGCKEEEEPQKAEIAQRREGDRAVDHLSARKAAAFCKAVSLIALLLQRVSSEKSPEQTDPQTSWAQSPASGNLLAGAQSLGFALSPCFFSAFPVKKVHLPGFYYSRISAAVALFPKNSEARFRSASRGKAFHPIAEKSRE